MKFFRDVVSHLVKNAFEAHTQFSVADDTAVGDNPIRSISLDAVPTGDNTIVSLAWEGGVKLFEKTLSEQEAQHQFDLISTDLAKVESLTKQGQYDTAKDLMKKLGQQYAENTGELVPTNMPKLNITQAAQNCPHCPHGVGSHGRSTDGCDEKGCRCEMTPHLIKNYKEAAKKCPECGKPMEYETKTSSGETLDYYCSKCKKTVAAEQDPDGDLLKQAKITMQNLWFSTPEELIDYQKKQKGAAGNGPLWEQNKGKAPAPAPKTDLAPASLSYEDAEAERERDHEDMQKHIDETIKTQLESAMQEKAASVFGPDQIELIKILKKNGRNWDEIKKILVKDFGFDKDSTNIFVDEQRQALDPAGIEVEPVKEDKKEAPLAPPEELVSPETHEKLLQDHEDKKKANPPLKEPSFTPQDVMNIPEEAEIQNYSSYEIARADNSDIHKIAADSPVCPQCGGPTEYIGDVAGHKEYWCRRDDLTTHKTATTKTAAADTNPLKEPIKEAPTTPNQDTIPFGKQDNHNAPKEGDRVFVTTDLGSEKGSFEGIYIKPIKGNHGEDLAIVQTDQGDLLEVESHRVAKTSDATGPQETEPVEQPTVEAPSEEIPVTPRQSDLVTSSLKQASSSDSIDEVVALPNHYKAMWISIYDSYAPDCAVYMRAVYDLEEQLGSDDLTIDGPGMGGDSIAHAEDYDSSDIMDALTQRMNPKWEKFKAKVAAMPDPLLPEMREQLMGEQHEWNTEQLQKQLADAKAKVQQLENEINLDEYTPTAAQREALSIRIKAKKLLAEVQNAGKTAFFYSKDGIKKEAAQNDSAWEANGWARVWVDQDDVAVDARYAEVLKNPDENARIAALREIARDIAYSHLSDGVERAGVYASFEFDSLEPSRFDRIDWGALANPVNEEEEDQRFEDEMAKKYGPDAALPEFRKPQSSQEPVIEKKASDFEKGISQNKTSADPTEGPKTHFKELKRAPDYAPSEQAIPADQELAGLLDRMEVVQQNLSTLKATRDQMMATLNEQIAQVDQAGGRAELEAELQGIVEKTGVILDAMDSKVAQHRDKLYTVQTQEIHYVEKLTPSDIVKRLYQKYAEAEKYINDVKNGMLSQAKKVLEKTVYKWPKKKSSVETESAETDVLAEFSHYNDELMAALQILSAPIE